MAQPETSFVENPYPYKQLTDDDELVFEKHKNNINQKIRETFPSIPADFELKPVRVSHIDACGIIYNYKVALPDNKFATVSFHTGGMSGPPGAENSGPPKLTFDVDETLTSTPDE